MLRNVSVCILALMVVLLFSSDASACRRSRTRCCGSGYGYYASSGCCGSGYGYYASSGGCGCSGYGNYSGMATGATVGTDTSGTATTPGGIGVQPGVGGVGRDYNPGGIGGPASGIGVRPGVGAGGLGRGR